MKTVNLPIRVPDGKYCWLGTSIESCEYFDNYGGHDTCKFFFLEYKRDVNGYPKKAKECLVLLEKNEKL
jgi:hypothetical protein